MQISENIWEMIRTKFAGYELHEETNSVYVTDNYFPMLGVFGVDVKNITVSQFQEIYEKRRQSLEYEEIKDNSIVYIVPHPDGSTRYLRWEYQEKNGHFVGIIEDVTEATLEKMQIRRERDSDLLTGLCTRRGFTKEMDKLFLTPEHLKHAALLMIDLDNLKTTNDNYGHEFGDLYIKTAGKCFMENTPDNTVCARISGDEFVIFFYGYDNQNDIRQKVEELYKAINEVKFVLPNGNNIGLSASGGISWYPENSSELSELLKYADFTMYQVKRTKKGDYKEFDIDIFKQFSQ